MNAAGPYWLSQHWFRKWFGAVSQQAILCGHMATLGHDELINSHRVLHTSPSRASCVVSYWIHYNDVIMSAMETQITSLTIVYSTVYSGADQRKHQSSASLAFVRGIHRWPVNSPHKGPLTRKMFPFNEVVKYFAEHWLHCNELRFCVLCCLLKFCINSCRAHGNTTHIQQAGKAIGTCTREMWL